MLARWVAERYAEAGAPLEVAQLGACSSPLLSWSLFETPLPSVTRLTRLAKLEERTFAASGLQVRAAEPVWARGYLDAEDRVPSSVTEVGVPASMLHERALAAGVDVLNQAMPAWSEVVVAAIYRFVVYRGAPDGFTGSTPRAFGAIFMSSYPTDPVMWAELTVHETCHMLLHAVRCSGRFMENEDEQAFSAFRREPRPMIGIFHAAAALRVMEDLLRQVVLAEVNRPSSNLISRMDSHRESRIQCTQALDQARWTDYGSRVRDAFLGPDREGTGHGIPMEA